MPRRKQGHFSQSELEGEEISDLKFSKPSLQNEIADESQSGKVRNFCVDSTPVAIIESPTTLSSGRRRRTGVVSMSPQPMQQSVVDNLSNTFCPFCKVLTINCACKPRNHDPKWLVQPPPRDAVRIEDKNYTGSLNQSANLIVNPSTVEVSTPKMAGPFNGQNIAQTSTKTCPSNECIILDFKSSVRLNESLVGGSPIMSSLPWQAMKREDSPLVLDCSPQNLVSPQHYGSSNKLSPATKTSDSSFTMLSTVYGMKSSNIETVLSGLVIDKPIASDEFNIDCDIRKKKENFFLTVDTDAPRTRCYSLPSSSFSLSNIVLSPDGGLVSPVLCKNAPKLNTSVAVSQSSSIQSLSGYSISKTCKLTRPEVIEQHISKIISENAAIVETQDPLWMKRYMRQSSLAMEANSDEESRKGKNDNKFRRFSEDVSVKYLKANQPSSPKFKSKLHSALLGKIDEVIYPYPSRKMSFDSRVKTRIGQQRVTSPLFGNDGQADFRSPDHASRPNAFKKVPEMLSLIDEKHPENPEGSIIKDLLLKARSSPSRKSPILVDEDSKSSRTSFSGENGIRQINFQPASNPLYYCLLCNIGFRSKENLEAHKSHYCKGLKESESSPDLLDVSAEWKSPGAVNKRSSSFSFPTCRSNFDGKMEISSGQILKKQLLSGTSKNVMTSKKRKISEPVFSDNVFGYPSVLKHGRSSACSSYNNSKLDNLGLETGFPSSSTNTSMLIPCVTPGISTSHSVVVTISKPVLNSGGTVVHYTNSQTRSSPVVVSSNFSSVLSTNVSGSVIVSPAPLAFEAASPIKIKKSTLNADGTHVDAKSQCAESESNRPSCLSSQSLPFQNSEKILIDANSDNLKDEALVKNDSIAQKTFASNIIVPTVILSPCSPVPVTEEDQASSSDNKIPKTTLFERTQQVASRPTTLSLSKKAGILVGSTIVSPETPRPKRSVIQLYINGQAYTRLGLKCSTRSFYCCIYQLQPMYVLQKTQPKLSMYSNWQTYPHKESLFGLTPGQEIALYDTRKGQRVNPLIFSMASISNTLVVTHSSYWKFRKQEGDVDLSESGQPPNGKLTDLPSDKLGENVLSSETSSGQVGMESDPTEEGKSVGQESVQGITEENNLEKSSSESNVPKDYDDGEKSNRKYSDEYKEVTVTGLPISNDPLPTVTKSPKRVRIFQGGYRSNEDYTYIRGRGRGKYVCEECGIRCKKPSMLKKHIRTHTDLRPYKCSHCVFAFKTKGNLTKHMKSKAHYKKCLELGIVPVPTTIDESQIDESALSRQFSDADDEDDDEDLDEDEDESDYDEDDDDSQDHRDDEEMCSSEKDVDGVTRGTDQFEDAESNVPVSSSSTVVLTCATSEDLVVTNSSPLLPLPDGDFAWDQEREAARSLLNLSSCGLGRINSTSDWVMTSPSPQINKSEGSIGSMESLSSAAGCLLSGSDIVDETGSDNIVGISRNHWTTLPELSPKSRRRSYSVNMPPARSGTNVETQLTNEGQVSREHQTRVISFASSLPVVLEDQPETTATRRYSMSAISESRSMAANNPSTSNFYHRTIPSELESSSLNLLDEDEAKQCEVLLQKNWVSVNGEQPMDLRVTKEPRENLSHLSLSLTPHLWKSNFGAGTGESSLVSTNDSKGYVVLTSPTSDLAMLSPERNATVSEYVYSGISPNRLSAGNYFPTSDGEEMTGSKMSYELPENVDVDGSIDMLEGAYSSEADDYQHPLSPVSQNSMDNDSQCNHLDECGSSLNSSGMDSYGVKERQQPCSASDRRTGASNPSQIEFRLSATVPSGSSISTSNHVRIESEGKCSCSICNKTFSKPSQLRLHVNIHYFERPFRCESCAVSFRTKGHLQKHKRSVSHYNKVNMNMTFGTPTTDNPRPFKCGDCKIAFRIHGHLAKHLRSKMHIMKLECLGKLPFGMYAEMERSGVNLNEIDTTDCENSLDSLQLMAHRLYQQDPRRMRWHTADGHAPPHPHSAQSNIHQVVTETEASHREVQSVKMSTPAQYSLSTSSIPVSHPSEEKLASLLVRRSSIISSPIQTQNAVPSRDPNPLYTRPSLSKEPLVMVTSANHSVKREPEELSCVTKSSNSLIVPPVNYVDNVNCVSTPTEIEYEQPPKVNVTVESNVPFLHRSGTCHLCGRVFKSAKFLQVHLYGDHPQQQNQQSWPSQTAATTTISSPCTVQEAIPKLGKDVTPQWLDCDRSVTNGILADSFSCDICRKQYPTQTILQQHLLTHAQPRPFVCETCDAGFTTHVMLATHLATHQQNKPFMCHECGKSFAQAVEFQRHVQAHLNDAS